MTDVLVGALVVSVVANAIVTLLIVRADMMTLKQKLAQSALVWLVPVVGAILMAIFISANRERPHATSQHVRDENDEAFRIAQGSQHHEP